jgi:AbrB family looped-hinge helix DNA binding protein
MPQAKVSQKYQIVIPKEARQEMKVGSGDKLIVEAPHGVTILLPKPKKMGRALRGLSKGM